MATPLHADAPPWDALVIGAGVAGASFALQFAHIRPAARILLVDRSRWPRPKVCGGCLNARAVGSLRTLGLLPRLLSAGAVQTNRVRIAHARTSATLRTPPGLAIARHALDAAIVEAAVDRGVCFLPACRAEIPPPPAPGPRPVRLHHADQAITQHAQLVIAADGLAGSSLAALPSLQPRIAPNAWIGLGATVPEAPIPLHEIRLHIGPHGYAGIVRLHDHAILAAAVDPEWLKSIGTPTAAVQAILAHCRAPDLARIVPPRLCGTPALTRRRTVSEPGLLILGDAASYVEPFTGEGMAWALDAARHAAHLAAHATSPSALAHDYARWQVSTSARRDRLCRVARTALHHPALATMATTLLTLAPVRALLEQHLSRPESPKPAPLPAHA